MTNLSPLFTWRSAVMSSELGARDRYVALALSLHMNEMGGSCFPSMQSLVKETKLTDRTIQAAIQSLEDAGWVEIDPGGGKKREVAQGIWAASNAYTAIFPQGFKTPERRSPPPRKRFGGSPEGVSDEDGDVQDSPAKEERPHDAQNDRPEPEHTPILSREPFNEPVRGPIQKASHSPSTSPQPT